MSRTGNMPIEIPDGIDVTLSETNITVKHNSGEKQFKFSKDLIISIENKKILIKPKELNKKTAVLKQDLEPFVERIMDYLDNENGGFKGAPKFPQFYIFDTIFYFYNKNKNNKFFNAVEKLLLNISSKGIYDHLEGGIARYTVDDKWVVPHFEKMLYDNILYVNLLNQFILKSNNNYLISKLIQTINFINNEFVSIKQHLKGKNIILKKN